MYQHTLISRLTAALHRRSAREVVRGSDRRHPACQTHSIRALMLAGRLREARRATAWLVERLGPNGLLYQYDFDDGAHSVEEDVMPTADLGLLLLEYPELGAAGDVLTRIASGIVGAQISSDDRNADGALRGLPGHPTFGEDAYGWDTTHAVLFLLKLIEIHPLDRERTRAA
jgi:hypothetical protein